MFKYLKQSIILTVITILMFGVGFPVLIWGVGQLMPNKSEGSPIIESGKVMGFENVGQNFTDDKYFNGRPSAVNYNAASTGGSNLGPTNPDYLALVQARIDTFLVHNPGIDKKDIPSDLVTASGSGIDPHITVQSAMIQVPRISKQRNISSEKLIQLVKDNTQKPVLGFFGIETVNVLKLNLALDKVK
jgi:K+-transporting ATPase ATPase C chain